MAQQWPPKRATAFTVIFPIRDANGVPVTGVAGLDSEVSNDGAAFADCTNEATEIGTTGFYSLTLTAAEMTADTVTVRVLSTSYPAVGFFILTTKSTWDEGIDAKAALTGAITAASFAAGAIDAAAIAADAIGSSELAASAVTEIQSGLATDASLSAVGATLGAAIAGVQADTDAIQVTLGAAGAGLTAIPWNASWDAEVQSEVQDALDATLADSVPADGTRPSIAQALYMLTQFMLERQVSGTTVSVKKPDGTTNLFTLTLNDASTPTTITRAT